MYLESDVNTIIESIKREGGKILLIMVPILETFFCILGFLDLIMVIFLELET